MVAATIEPPKFTVQSTVVAFNAQGVRNLRNEPVIRVIVSDWGAVSGINLQTRCQGNGILTRVGIGLSDGLGDRAGPRTTGGRDGVGCAHGRSCRLVCLL